MTGVEKRGQSVSAFNCTIVELDLLKPAFVIGQGVVVATELVSS